MYRLSRVLGSLVGRRAPSVRALSSHISVKDAEKLELPKDDVTVCVSWLKKPASYVPMLLCTCTLDAIHSPHNTHTLVTACTNNVSSFSRCVGVGEVGEETEGCTVC